MHYSKNQATADKVVADIALSMRRLELKPARCQIVFMRSPSIRSIGSYATAH
jgi:hypothetical protein